MVSQNRLLKPPPEDMAKMMAIDTMRKTIKELQKNIAELQATLPEVESHRLKKSERFIIDPWTNQKKYY